MSSFPQKIRNLRLQTGRKLGVVANELNIDSAILSKMERGQRKATRIQVEKLAKYYNTSLDELIVSWLSDNLVYEVEKENMAVEILHAAEEKLLYKRIVKPGKEAILKQIKQVLAAFPAIQNAWIYGSFSRGDDNSTSDVDIALKTDEGLSYFDLAEIQHQIEKAIKRKTDIGFIDSFKPYIFDNLKPDLKLIYERSQH